ncbi:MAG: hypothetical protein WCQ21_26440 [Verrucomicrobiota bacterium]
MSHLLLSLAGLLLILPPICVRLLFLVPGPLGWITYLANTLSEAFVKKLHWPRPAVEFSMALGGIGLLLAGHTPTALLLASVTTFIVLELYVSRQERHLLTTSYSPLDRIGIRGLKPHQTHGLSNGYPTPSTHPELTVNLIGPFATRVPRYDLGQLLVGHPFQLRLIIGNHTIVPTQTGLRLGFSSQAHLQLLAPATLAPGLLPRLRPGEVHEIAFQVTATHALAAGSIRFCIEWGHFAKVIEVFHGEARPLAGTPIVTTAITRYPGACQSAFAWRGDMDLYDESTLQSIAGLETTLGLAARYRLPQTMYLSTRLSIDEPAARAWAAHYEVDRGAAQIPAFIHWMQTKVELCHNATYPFHSAKPYLMELGNHGHLHFGTDTAGAKENGWKPKARMGAGDYPWLTNDRSSWGEQRDNAREARRLIEQIFHYSPRSWAMPNRTNDYHTAAALQAAGCDVLSDSNVKARHNVLLQPPPHHPNNTCAVELTKRYPGDPQHIYHVAMNLFWVHRAHRRGIPVVFMCHQHLRQFDGYACTRLTEYTLRYVLTRFNGDLHINTVFGIGKYWREVISPQTQTVFVAAHDQAVVVSNQSSLDLIDAPVDINLADGRRLTLLVNVPKQSSARFDLAAGRTPAHAT